MRTRPPKGFVENKQPLLEDDFDDDFKGPKFLSKFGTAQFELPESNVVVRTNRKFKSPFLRQVYYLSKMGFRDQDMAEFFQVSVNKFSEWKRTIDGFYAILEEGRTFFSMKVVETLGQRALGYDYVEKEYSQHVDRQGRVHNLEKTTHKHMPPDTTAIMFYLKNRHPDQWGDVHRIENNIRMQLEESKTLNLNIFNEKELEVINSIAVKSIAQTHGQSEVG